MRFEVLFLKFSAVAPTKARRSPSAKTHATGLMQHQDRRAICLPAKAKRRVHQNKTTVRIVRLR